MHHDGNLVDRRTYDPLGRMDTSTYGNGVVTSHTYNDNTLALIAHSGTGTSIGDYSYTWDANKNKLSETITGVMSGYGFDNTAYDTEDRLASWNRDDSNLDQSWNLSPVGDWNYITENGNVQSRTHGPTHELLTADSQSVTHDAKGNMTLIPASLRPNALSLTWDQDNRMSSATTDGKTVSQRFDALGRRVARNNDIYVQVGQQTVADYASGSTLHAPSFTYVYASYIDEPITRVGTGGLRYYHRNQQYSITALTDSSGNVTERYAYTAYGTPTITDGVGATLTTSADNNRYTYTGREWDDVLSLYHFRARMYDSFSGRFVSRDPAGYIDGESQYRAYFALKFTDPSGLHFATGRCITCEWGEAGYTSNYAAVAEITLCGSLNNDCKVVDKECKDCEDRCKGTVWVDFDVTIVHLGKKFNEFAEGTRQSMFACGESDRLKLPTGLLDKEDITGSIDGKGGCDVPCCGGNDGGEVVFKRRGGKRFLTFKWNLSVDGECGSGVQLHIDGPEKTGPADQGISTYQKHWIRCF